MTHAVAAVARGLEPPVVLLAHPFGALPALAAAATGSRRPDGVILVDPDPPWRPEWEAAFPLLDARRSDEERRTLALMEAAGAPRASVQEAEAYLRLRLAAYFADPADAGAFRPCSSRRTCLCWGGWAPQYEPTRGAGRWGSASTRSARPSW